MYGHFPHLWSLILLCTAFTCLLRWHLYFALYRHISHCKTFCLFTDMLITFPPYAQYNNWRCLADQHHNSKTEWKPFPFPILYTDYAVMCVHVSFKWHSAQLILHYFIWSSCVVSCSSGDIYGRSKRCAKLPKSANFTFPSPHNVPAK